MSDSDERDSYIFWATLDPEGDESCEFKYKPSYMHTQSSGSSGNSSNFQIRSLLMNYL